MIVETTVTPRYAETDQMGVVHHAVYPIWYELGREAYLRGLGLSYAGLEAQGIMAPLVDLHCRYRESARYNEELILSTWMTAMTPSRVVFAFAIRRQGEDRPFHTGETTLCWVDAQSFHPISLKKRLPQVYQRLSQVIQSSLDEPGERGQG